VYRLWPAESGWREIMMGPWPTVLILSPVLIALAAASWHFIEAPLERVKRRLVYAPASTAAAAHL
jgi:peptidoglycan/LPS O-acetylase OafA/YrhL